MEEFFVPFKGRQKGCFATFLWKDGVFFPHLDWRIPFLFKSAEKEMENEQKEKRIFLRETRGRNKKTGRLRWGSRPSNVGITVCFISSFRQPL